MTPARARALLLWIVLAWLGVIALWLVRDGVRGLRGGPIRGSHGRGTVHEGRAAVLHGALRLAVGGALLAWVVWVFA